MATSKFKVRLVWKTPELAWRKRPVNQAYAATARLSDDPVETMFSVLLRRGTPSQRLCGDRSHNRQFKTSPNEINHPIPTVRFVKVIRTNYPLSSSRLERYTGATKKKEPMYNHVPWEITILIPENIPDIIARMKPGVSLTVHEGPKVVANCVILASAPDYSGAELMEA